MANIVIRRGGNGGQIAQSMQNVMEPWRWMRDLMRWDPFQEMAPMGLEERPGLFAPTFEVKESKDTFLFKADVPGVKEQDLEITCTGNRLTVNGKRESEQQEKGDTFFLYERAYGSFTRSFTLPDGCDTDHIRAELKDGVLTIALPKKPEMMPKKISIKSTEKGEKHS